MKSKQAENSCVNTDDAGNPREKFLETHCTFHNIFNKASYPCMVKDMSIQLTRGIGEGNDTCTNLNEGIIFKTKFNKNNNFLF